MLFDTHAHYDDEAFDPDRREVLAGLPQRGVGLVVDPGCTLTSSEKAVALAAEFPHVYAAVGLHPENCHDFQPEQIERLRQLARREKVVAIGEVGLDYYWEENPPRALQQEVLRRQLALAEELKLPVIFHDREAHEDTLRLLREVRPRGVIHCFSGSVEMMREAVALGLYIGLGGAVTFKNARRPAEVAAAVPEDRLLLETDAPYMAPVPFRGKRCDSSLIPYTAEKIALARSEKEGFIITPKEILNATKNNAARLYGITPEVL